MSDPNSTPPGPTPPNSVPPAGGQQQPYQQPQYQQPQYQQPAPAGPLTPDQDKQYSFWAHLGGIVGFLPSLIIYLVFKDRSNPANPVQVKYEAKEALNWQITWTIAYVVVLIAVGILSGIAVSLAFSTGSTALLTVSSLLGWLPWILWILNVVFSVLGAVKTNSGGAYRYPVNFRFIK